MQPAQRFSPLSRIAIFSILVLGTMAVFFLMLLVGSSLATVWTGRSTTQQWAVTADLVNNYALQLTLFIYPAIFAWLYYCRTKLDGRSLASLGLRTARLLPDLARGLITGGLTIGLLFAVLWLSGAIHVVGWDPTAFDDGAAKSVCALLGWMGMFFAVGFMEEVVFRGYFLNNLTAWLGWRGGVIAQAVLFGLIHMGNLSGQSASQQITALFALPSLILIGVFFALAYGRTGSLWFPIGFHWGWNFFLGCVFSLPVSGIPTFRVLDIEVNGPSWLTGGAFGAEGSLLLPVVLLTLIYFLKLSPQHPQAVLDQQWTLAASPPPAPAQEEAETEESRENRFRTRFGHTETFDADTLRQLKEMQEERRLAAEEEAKRNRDLMEAMKRATSLARSETEETTGPETTIGEQVLERGMAVPVEAARVETTPEPVEIPVPEPTPVPSPTPAPEPVVTAPAATLPEPEAQPAVAEEPAPIVIPPAAQPAASPSKPAEPAPPKTATKKPAPRW
jgi:hypothetical protein